MPSILGTKKSWILLALSAAVVLLSFAVCGVQNKEVMMRADLPEDYESWGACEKRDFLFDKNIIETKHSVLPPLEDLSIKWLLTHYLNMWPKMYRTQDTVARGWTKFIHARATVAKVRWVSSENHLFSGVFAGNDCGLLRFSLTYDPKKRGVAPGLALKFLNTGFASSNASFLTSLDPQGSDYNWFKNVFTHAVPEGKGLGAKVVHTAFRAHSRFPTRLSIDDLGTYLNTQSVRVPTQIFLKPLLQFASQPARDFRTDFSQIQPGTALFDVYAYEGQTQELTNVTSDGNRKRIRGAIKIGTIVSESNFVASEFGDRILFFKHRAAD